MPRVDRVAVPHVGGRGGLPRVRRLRLGARPGADVRFTMQQEFDVGVVVVVIVDGVALIGQVANGDRRRGEPD